MFDFDIDIGYTSRTVPLGAANLGAVGGVLGSFATLRRQSPVGDALAHAALPGVCLAFLANGLGQPLPLLAGAILPRLADRLAPLVVRGRRIKEDAALGIVLSGSFGFATLLPTLIQHRGNAAQSGLDRFLVGQAATLLERDVVTMAVPAAAVLAVA